MKMPTEHAWIHDPKYGRDLAVGERAVQVTGKLLLQRNILALWSEESENCLNTLEGLSHALGNLVRGELDITFLRRGDDRDFLEDLVEQANAYPQGPLAWLEHYGDLKKEAWRYLGALVGDQLPALNPDREKFQLSGGAHYGHISAMLEAGYEASHMLAEHFRVNDIATHVKPHSRDITSTLDGEVDEKVRAILLQHYPDYHYHSEDNKHETRLPVEGDKRFLVDALDGTRNYFAGNDKYAVSLACQIFQQGEWVTTDAVVAEPANGRIYWAEKGAGAFCIDKEGGRERKLVVQPQPQASPPPSAREVMQGKIIDASILGMGEAKYEFLKRMNMLGATDHNIGCSALMLCMTAGHGNHAAVMTSMPHDVEAGILIAKEAGVQIDQHCFTRELATGPHAFTAYIAAQDPAMLSVVKTGIKQSFEAVQARGRA